MVMVLIGVDALIARRVAADLDPLHEVELLELVEGPVDARAAHRIEPAVDLECRHGASLFTQQLDDLAPRSAAAVAGLVEAAHR
jgi:hypothetical protein